MDSKVRFIVPTTLDPMPFAEKDDFLSKLFPGQEILEKQYERLGIIPNYSCAPYLKEQGPNRGDILAWVESSAVVFANSVLGARTNLNSGLLDLCSSILGKTPDFGLTKGKNRLGDIRVLLKLNREVEFALLGHYVGRFSPKSGWEGAFL